uniref:Uncharacterized protein n=1 Tax=Anguilla anguilla TaxID=7936 RepID=A0A0E9W4Y1_ANGAN
MQNLVIMQNPKYVTAPGLCDAVFLYLYITANNQQLTLKKQP